VHAGAPQPSYRTAAFAALAGVTPRALRHYERLGLLTPKRSTSGYRLYSEHDLETLEEIVALRFIGVPLKKIAVLRRRSTASFVEILRAQRVVIEAKRDVLARAIDAIGRAEACLGSGPVDAILFRQIIEVMQMDTNHEETLKTYGAMLKAKVSHLAAMSSVQREELRQAWARLIADINKAITAGEAPEGAAAQGLLERWISLFSAATGADAATAERAMTTSAEPTTKLRDALWERRAEWMPAGDPARSSNPISAGQARARAEALAQSLAAPDVMRFITLARSARH
jgi:MerR family transcriptional regulator, thiopeptide resistance regulator